LTSFDNEEHDNVRNSHTDIVDSSHLDLLVHGRYLEDHRECEGLQRSSGGSMLVLWFRPFRVLRTYSSCVVQLTSVSTKFSNKDWRYVHNTKVIREQYRELIVTIYSQNGSRGHEDVDYGTLIFQFQTKRGGERVIKSVEFHRGEQV